LISISISEAFLCGLNQMTSRHSYVSLCSPKTNDIDLHVWSISLRSQQNDEYSILMCWG
jgi:hypothetical protein